MDWRTGDKGEEGIASHLRGSVRQCWKKQKIKSRRRRWSFGWTTVSPQDTSRTKC